MSPERILGIVLVAEHAQAHAQTIVRGAQSSTSNAGHRAEPGTAQKLGIRQGRPILSLLRRREGSEAPSIVVRLHTTGFSVSKVVLMV